jgi:hypothetical protein
MIPMQKPFLLRYYTEVISTLKQRIVVIFDHVNIREFEIGRSLLFTNNMHEYDTIYNASHDGEETGIEIKLSEILAFHRIVDGNDSWRIGGYFFR